MACTLAKQIDTIAPFSNCAARSHGMVSEITEFSSEWSMNEELALNMTNHTNSHSATIAKPVAQRKSRGQGMTEYIIILGLIAIAAIAAFSFFGQTVRSQVAGMAKEVGGESGKEGITAAQAASGKALTNAQKNMNMSTYTEGGNDGAK